MVLEDPVAATVSQNGCKQSLGTGLSKQSLGCGTERREVRDTLQAENVTQVGPLGQHDMYAAVVEFVEFLDDQTRQQLRLCEFAGTLAMRVVIQSVLRRLQCHPCHCQSALAGLHRPLSKGS